METINIFQKPLFLVSGLSITLAPIITDVYIYETINSILTLYSATYTFNYKKSSFSSLFWLCGEHSYCDTNLYKNDYGQIIIEIIKQHGSSTFWMNYVRQIYKTFKHVAINNYSVWDPESDPTMKLEGLIPLDYHRYNSIDDAKINKNANSFSIDNLELICPNCHFEEHYLEKVI